MAVIDLTVFTLARDETSFVAADAQMQTDFVYQQSGCLRRTTARGDNGDWLVITLWTDPGSADAAAQAAEQDPVARRFWAHVAPDSVRTRRFTPLPG